MDNKEHVKMLADTLERRLLGCSKYESSLGRFWDSWARFTQTSGKHTVEPFAERARMEPVGIS